MKTSWMRWITMAVLVLGATGARAGEGVAMKCGADGDCGFETRVAFGGGMLFEQVTGYCRACKKFVYLRWTRDGIPPEIKEQIKVEPKPAPLGEVWDAGRGEVRTVHACPDCKGPFVEIRSPDELTHCPKCNEPPFARDETKPRLSID